MECSYNIGISIGRNLVLNPFAAVLKPVCNFTQCWICSHKWVPGYW